MLDEFIERFKNGTYEITTTVPSEETILEDVIQELKDPAMYEKMFNDASAYMRYYSITYTSGEEQLNFPIGVYGTSPNFKTRYPLIVGYFWTVLLSLNRTQFCAISEIEEDEKSVEHFEKLLQVREDFMVKVFRYYQTIDKETNSVMSWSRREKESITRTHAESLGYIRKIYHLKEFYASQELDNEAWTYIKKTAYLRELIMSSSKDEKPTFDYPNVGAFLKGITNYKSQKISESV